MYIDNDSSGITALKIGMGNKIQIKVRTMAWEVGSATDLHLSVILAQTLKNAKFEFLEKE